MRLLAGVNYDPAVRVQKATTALTALTALDTTNLRLTFVAPSSGNVLVSLRSSLRGAITTAQVFLGVLDGSTVKGRMQGLQGRTTAPANANSLQAISSTFLITGLTPGTSYTWDAAYGVEVVLASTNLEYGGPDDTTAGNAAGGFQFLIWDAGGLLAGKLYDPTTAASVQASAASAMTAIDTTNLRLTFTAPNGGIVIARLRTVVAGASPLCAPLLGILDGATIRGRQAGLGGVSNISTLAATDRCPIEAVFVVTGLTAGTSYTWDAAWGIELGGTSNVLKWGGPDDTTSDNAWGGFAFEVWQPTDVPLAIAGMV